MTSDTYRIPLNIDQFFLGVDRLMSDLTLPESIKGLESTNFPPYNLVRHKDGHYTIDLALAGFDKEEVAVEMLSNNWLVVRSKTELAEQEQPGVEVFRKNVHKKTFARKFKLADNLEVGKVMMANGLMTIQIVQKSQVERVQRFNIE